MFLKRIEMQGFKSFADRTVINFEDSVTGVVDQMVAANLISQMP